jgi:hypothetical protein
MRNILTAALMLVAFGMTFGGAHAGAAGQMVGGFKPVAADDPEVTAAARFAVAARGKSENADIILNSVLAAERQTVAGANYRLCLEVEVEGAAQNVRAVVFKSLQKQYQLKSWEAADCGGSQ